jgi:hypothetical protein
MARASSASEIIGWTKTGRPASGAPIPALFSADQLDAWQRNIVAQVEDMAEEAAVGMLKEQTVQARDEVLARETARSGGIPPLYTLVIDAVADAPMSAIHPDSVITLLWNYTPEVVQRTYDALVQRSPRRTGRYIASHMIFADGEAIADYRGVTRDTQVVTIVATTPYARRLEVGKDALGHAFVKQVAPHIVEETSIYARRKFGDLSRITYIYSELSNAWALKTAAGLFARHFEKGKWRTSGTPRTRHGMLETHVKYPAIVISPRE